MTLKSFAALPHSVKFSVLFFPDRHTSGTNLLDGDYQQRLALRLLLRLSVEAEEILPPEDGVDIPPAIKVLPQLNGGRRTLMGGVADDLEGLKKKKKRYDVSKYLDLELPADDWLDHAERLSDQAAARTAVQRQPEGVVLFGVGGVYDNEELGEVAEPGEEGKRKEVTYLQRRGTSRAS